jgi:hypothetical protein
LCDLWQCSDGLMGSHTARTHARTRNVSNAAWSVQTTLLRKRTRNPSARSPTRAAAAAEKRTSAVQPHSRECTRVGPAAVWQCTRVGPAAVWQCTRVGPAAVWQCTRVGPAAVWQCSLRGHCQVGAHIHLGELRVDRLRNSVHQPRNRPHSVKNIAIHHLRRLQLGVNLLGTHVDCRRE